MSEKKRKSKRPKSMRVTTEASKVKLPKPKRTRKPTLMKATNENLRESLRLSERLAAPRETWAEGYAKWEAKAERVRCPRCEKLVLAGPLDIHTCYDAKALREPRAIPCGADIQRIKAWHEQHHTSATTLPAFIWPTDDMLLLPPPDTSAYPWGLKFAWWLDGVPTRVRRWLAAHLRWLAGKVMP